MHAVPDADAGKPEATIAVNPFVSTHWNDVGTNPGQTDVISFKRATWKVQFSTALIDASGTARTRSPPTVMHSNRPWRLVVVWVVVWVEVAVDVTVLVTVDVGELVALNVAVVVPDEDALVVPDEVNDVVAVDDWVVVGVEVGEVVAVVVVGDDVVCPCVILGSEPITAGNIGGGWVHRRVAGWVNERLSDEVRDIVTLTSGICANLDEETDKQMCIEQ
jgi:hypothetical protein|eukprot:m.88063 g.88063  ORF g.88063 m.88063 type:complete len:219 (+) comp19962_c0_seq7:7014-7670(+)